MSNITNIIYPCPNSDMGDMSSAECAAYRAWVLGQLETEYPTASITVTASNGRIEVEMEDDSDPSDSVDDVLAFGNRCWENAPDMSE